MKRILTFLCIAISSYALFAQQSIRHTVNFSPYVVDSLYVDGNTYNTIKIDSCDSYAEVGKPVLPVKYVRLLIPKGTRATGIVINQTNSEQTQILSHKVSYRTPPVPMGEVIEQDTVGFDTILYSQSTPYPISRVAIVGSGYFRGNCIVTIAIYPILYTPSINQISYVSNIDFSLQYVTDTSLKNDMYFDDEDRELLSHMIDNPNNIIAFAPLNILPNDNGTKNISVNSKYLIVTERKLIPAFAEFMDWKRRKGITIQAVAIEDILTDPDYPGDLISNIYDDAGKLRQFLLYASQNGVKFVLLAGSSIPIRKANYIMSDEKEKIIPTDLYFSEFYSKWDWDGDGYYGSRNDYINYYPSIYIGRIMPLNEWEVKNWTRKILVYEQNPGNGDGSYLTKGLFTQSDAMQLNDIFHNYLQGSIPGLNYNLIEEIPEAYSENTPTYPKGSDVINEFNNHYGIASFMAHGSPNHIGVGTKGNNNSPKYDIFSFDRDLHPNMAIEEQGNGFDNMTNYCYPTIYYSMSCITMPFDKGNDLPENSQLSEDSRTMGDTYTCAVKGGGPAYLGNTRSVPYDNMSALISTFFQKAYSNYNNTFNIGIIEVETKDALNRYDYYDNLTYLSHNLMGCPETELWTGIPDHFNQVSIQENGNSLIVNTGLDNVSICVMSAFDNKIKIANNVSSSYTFENIFEDMPKPYNVTITKHNYFPYLYNPNEIYIQNVQWNDQRVISANNFFIGTNVTNDISYGNVIINSPANIILKADGDVYIKSEFEVTSGASFEIKINNSNENTCL